MLLNSDLDTENGLTKFIEEAEKFSACPESIVYLRDCEQKGLSLRNMLFDVLKSNPADIGKSWLFWIRLEMKSVISDEIGEIISKQLTENEDDPSVTARFLLTGHCKSTMGASERAFLESLRVR